MNASYSVDETDENKTSILTLECYRDKFRSPSLPIHLTPTDLWNDPVAMAGLLALWDDAMGAVRDPGWRNGRDGQRTDTSSEIVCRCA